MALRQSPAKLTGRRPAEAALATNRASSLLMTAIRACLVPGAKSGSLTVQSLPWNVFNPGRASSKKNGVRMKLFIIPLVIPVIVVAIPS